MEESEGVNILLNYRYKNERLEEALQSLGHIVLYNLWGIKEILAQQIDTVIFEFKQILKEEWRFFNLALRLKKYGLPRVTWCLDLPNYGASHWKLPVIKKTGLLDVFASYSLQGLSGTRMKVLYLPNAAWMSKYNLRQTTLEDLRNPDRYENDVSFLGNIDSKKYPEHRERTEFLYSLGRLLNDQKISYRFLDSRILDYDTQVGIIQKSKININVGCAADTAAERSWGLPERCYGIPVCGGFLLSDERLHAKEDFVAGEEIIMFSNLEDCVKKIKYYLSAHEERRKIAENAYRKVLAEHTYRHRADKLVNCIKEFKADRCRN